MPNWSELIDFNSIEFRGSEGGFRVICTVVDVTMGLKTSIRIINGDLISSCGLIGLHSL